MLFLKFYEGTCDMISFLMMVPCRCLLTPACEGRSKYSIVLEMTGLRSFVNIHTHMCSTDY